MRQPAGREICDLARGHGVFCLQGDGNDADAVYAIADKAIRHARAGRGPAFIEFKTYRWLEHCGPLDDEHLGYRPGGELQAWKERDPLALYVQRLQSRGAVSEAELARMRRNIRAEIDDAVAFAKSSPFPERDQLTAHVYAL